MKPGSAGIAFTSCPQSDPTLPTHHGPALLWPLCCSYLPLLNPPNQVLTSNKLYIVSKKPVLLYAQQCHVLYAFSCMLPVPNSTELCRLHCCAHYNSAASTLVVMQLLPLALHWDVEAACTHVQTGWLTGQSPVV